MNSYGQFCPVAKACELLCERWTLLVVRELVCGSRHFNDLRRGVPRMSPALLVRRLRQLERNGIIRRLAQGRRGSAYELTQAGLELRPLVESMGVWGHRWVRSDLRRRDLDAGLLMWDIRRSVQAREFPAQRVVVEFVFRDAPSGLGRWWLVSTKGLTDLCMEDPGYEVDVIVRSSVRALTAVWMRKCSIQQAQRDGAIEVMGPRALLQRLPAWLGGSSIATMGAESLARDPAHPIRRPGLAAAALVERARISA